MKHVLILQTGGTIMMQTDVLIAGKVDADPDKARGYLQNKVPELANIAHIQVMELFYEDSSSLAPRHWTILADTIYKYRNEFDGFVVLHGTDTMAYTASALSFVLNGLNKPVIFTGSQVPLTTLRSDARRNLVNSIEIATYDIPEVCICFNDKLYRANRSTKMSIGDFDAFASPNLLPLAEIGLTIDVSNHVLEPKDQWEYHSSFNENIYVLKLFPGLNPTHLQYLVDAPIQAILVEGFGAGNFPIKESYSLEHFFRACIKNGKIVSMCSQAPFDAIDLDKYESGRLAIDIGIISSKEMTIEASATKLMYLLSVCDNTQTVKELYQKNLCGEIN